MPGNKNSGRKAKSLELAEAINSGLANVIANEELVRIKESEKRQREDLREIVMPVVLKSMTEKKQIDGDLNIIIEKEIADRENADTKTSDNSQ